MNYSVRRLFNFLICFGLVFSLIIFSLLSLPVTSQNVISPQKNEIRGVWLTNVASGVLYVPWGINRALNQLSTVKFNTVYPVVWNRGYTFYNSKLAKQVTGRTAEPLLRLLHFGQDVLQQIIKLGNQKKLRVIPWFEYGFMTPSNSSLARFYPQWLTIENSGEKTILHGPQELIKISSEGFRIRQFVRRFFRQEAWLNPLHPEVQSFIKGLILEVVQNYDVDGIQLDDHFGMPVTFGYDEFTIKLYQKEHQGKSPPNNPSNPEWMRWRADKITAFMAEIAKDVRSIKPNIVISLSPNSKYFAYKNYLQDWETWVNKGLIDELVIQVYRHNKTDFITELKQPALKSAIQKIPVGVGIFTGNPQTPIEIKQIREQVEIVRQTKFNGVSFFYWETLWGYMTPEPPKQRRKNFLELFSQ
ncbi:MAG: family 10 glycosylhydrolase [Mastigocoleus sp. MO_167.B18]|nr:family 10 glycosylhydrolase [Mastigocoleus sp. MO_167.B18]